ncbi:hypothetical protein, partial [Shewanella sp. DW31]|uniref:hypothetical protein n=1 Tax=Shewanella sp. DW31 TaxID=2699422 RepID=UPI001A7E23E1
HQITLQGASSLQSNDLYVNHQGILQSTTESSSVAPQCIQAIEHYITISPYLLKQRFANVCCLGHDYVCFIGFNLIQTVAV